MLTRRRSSSLTAEGVPCPSMEDRAILVKSLKYGPAAILPPDEPPRTRKRKNKSNPSTPTKHLAGSPVTGKLPTSPIVTTPITPNIARVAPTSPPLHFSPKIVLSPAPISSPGPTPTSSPTLTPTSAPAPVKKPIVSVSPVLPPPPTAHQQPPAVPSQNHCTSNVATKNEFDLEQAPTFYPTNEEFEKPLEYISSIRAKAEPFGICRIAAPPQFRDKVRKFFIKSILNRDNFKFKTKLQSIHQLRTRHSKNEIFVARLRVFLLKRGIDIKGNTPKLDGKELDFYKLYTSVVKRGGFQEVSNQRQWKQVAKDLKISSDCTSATYNLTKHYNNFLRAYEEHQTQLQKQTAEGAPTTDEYATTLCESCKGVQDEEKMLLCDSCNLGYHIYCLDPPLAEIPKGEWYCKECNDFGFFEGKDFTLSSFQLQADAFKRKWFQSIREYSNHPNPCGDAFQVDPLEVESEYWRIVDDSTDQVRVHYGSDLDVSMHSSGFPCPGHPICGEKMMDKDDTEYWSKTLAEGGVGEAIGWNVNYLPNVEGSLLKHLNESVPGVTIPMLYIGMLFSSFCWHTEDNYLYSINYLHYGAPKTWYGSPGTASEPFEKTMEKEVPELFQSNPDLLHQLVTMVSPGTMKAAGVPVYTTIQQPGHFIITFPRAYHAGFSHGFNCAESVNFAIDDWLPHGQASVEQYRTTHRLSVFPLPMIVMRASFDNHGPERAKWLLDYLKYLRAEQESERKSVQEKGMQKVEIPIRILDNNEDVPQCAVCNHDCYLSYVTCETCKKRSCPRDEAQTCSCPSSQKCFVERIDMEFLNKLIDREEAIVRGDANVPVVTHP